MSKRMVMITTDSHVGRMEIDFSPYFDPQYRDAYAEQRDVAAAFMEQMVGAGGFLTAQMGGGTSFFSPAAVAAQQELRRQKIEELGIDGWRDDEFMSVVGDSDPKLRLKELEADGTVGAVLFPQAGPFAMGRPADDDTHWGGIRAHNRWLADFVADEPERWAATIQIDLADIDRTIEELRWGKEHGLRGGAFVGGNAPPTLPSYNSDYYDPLWAVLEELALPFTMHAAFDDRLLAGVGTNQRGGGALMQLGTYQYLTRGGPLSHFVFGGVFERYPGLRLVVAETGGIEWMARARDAFEEVYDTTETRVTRIKPKDALWDLHPVGCHELPRRPRDYISDNVFVQIHCHPVDWALFSKVGPENLVWGSDFPHAESTWPNSVRYLQEQIRNAAVPLADVEQVLSTNPAAIYGFDLGALQPIADRVGPSFEE
jgi:predicted TIM-barrel fold metal-dependent hydrolase